jgi:dTDP-4-dehydrorhamnose 3,5-epimerase
VELVPQQIPEVLLITPTVHGDGRGYFVETFRQDQFEQAVGHRVNFIQDNQSRSSKGVLRGLHYQLPPYAQSKLVRVIEGCVLDVAVDIRSDSPTFGQHVTAELSNENKQQLWIPRGFAHGFVVLSDFATFFYKVDSYYAPEHDRGLAFNDPALNINWKLPQQLLKLSEKDQNQPVLEQSKSVFSYGENLYE